MSLYNDIKYVNLFSRSLENFKRKSEYLWNFRCPICGDSKKKKSKSRGYIFKKNNDLFFKCHNCNIGLSLGNFIKHIDKTLYNEYVFERYSSGESVKKPHIKPDWKEIQKITKNIIDLPRVSNLLKTHIAYEYLIKRKIPNSCFSMFYYVNDFHSWAFKITNGEYKKNINNETTDPRIIIPFFDIEKKLIAVQGRALLQNNERYITLKLDESKMKIFGLERWKPNMITYITEGPFDSIFLPNSLAMAGSSINMTTFMNTFNIDKNNIVFVYDNECRNKEIVNLMIDVVNSGFKIVIWPKLIKNKDINEMIIDGMTQNEILNIINLNTQSGLQAILSINAWKKC